MPTTTNGGPARSSSPIPLPMLDARDGSSHFMDVDAYSEALGAERTRFPALCGRMVLAASLTAPVGAPRCEPCRREVRRRAIDDAVTVTTRSNRVWVRRIVGLVGRTSRGEGGPR